MVELKSRPITRTESRLTPPPLTDHRGALICARCGRIIRVSWPVRSVLCGCGAQLFPDPLTGTGPRVREA